MSILVVTNSLDVVRGSVEDAIGYMSYADFYAAIYSEDGFDSPAEVWLIDANDIDEGLYEDLQGVEEVEVQYFTLTGEVQHFFTDEELSEINDFTDLVDDVNNGDSYGPSNHQEELVDDFEINMGPQQPQQQQNPYSGDTGVINTEELLNGNVKADIVGLLNNTGEAVEKENKGEGIYDNKNAKVYLFGSSKGGSGKTFTTIISARRYAMTHPDESVALLDFDIIDGQVGISIHSMTPTMFNYYREYMKGYDDYRTMKENVVKGNDKMPDNLDFFLAPNNGRIIQNDQFWLNILSNLIHNYDVLFIDTGIDYLNVHPISYAYKIADKINITTTTSIKSVNSVTKMINKLTGQVQNPVFSRDDELESKINIIITQMDTGDEMNMTAYESLSKLANIEATFGVITRSVSQAEYYGFWDVFDDNEPFCNALDGILEM